MEPVKESEAETVIEVAMGMEGLPSCHFQSLWASSSPLDKVNIIHKMKGEIISIPCFGHWLL